MNRTHAVPAARSLHPILVVLVLALTPRVLGAQFPGTWPPPLPPPDVPNDSRLLIKDVEPVLGKVKGRVENTSNIVLEDVTITAYHILGHILAYTIVGTLQPGQTAYWEISEPADIPHAGRLPFNPFLGSRAR